MKIIGFKMSKLLYTCKQATEAAIRKEMVPLPFGKRMLVWFHLLQCKWCRTFYRQNSQIHRAMQEDGPKLELSQEIKKKLEFSLEKGTSGMGPSD